MDNVNGIMWAIHLQQLGHIKNLKLFIFCKPAKQHYYKPLHWSSITQFCLSIYFCLSTLLMFSYFLLASFQKISCLLLNSVSLCLLQSKFYFLSFSILLSLQSPTQFVPKVILLQGQKVYTKELYSKAALNVSIILPQKKNLQRTGSMISLSQNFPRYLPGMASAMMHSG